MYGNDALTAVVETHPGDSEARDTARVRRTWTEDGG